MTCRHKTSSIFICLSLAVPPNPPPSLTTENISFMNNSPSGPPPPPARRFFTAGFKPEADVSALWLMEAEGFIFTRQL